MDSTAAPQAGESPFARSLPGELRRPWAHAILVTPGSKATADGSGGVSVPPGCWSTTRRKGVLLQHRALWSHQGGTWGLPGGALHQGEEAITGRCGRHREEAAVPPENVRVLFTSVFDVGYWSYTTVVAEALSRSSRHQ